MDQSDICLCLHTREEHLGGNCARVNCRCKQFVLVDFGPALLAALKTAHQEMVGLRGLPGDMRAQCNRGQHSHACP
jgi:hypothetical protein